MKYYLFVKYVKSLIIEYILIFLTATIFFFISTTITFALENVFTIEDVEVKGNVDINFSRDNYLNSAFTKSFDILISKIILSKDRSKIGKANLKQVKNLIKSFQVLEEIYSKNEYKIKLKVNFNEIEVKKFLVKKNVSFSQPQKISALFYPVLFINNEIKSFENNFFFNEWVNIRIKNELINFILPLEDLDDISKITRMKNQIEELNVDSLVNKYNTKNYVFALMDYYDSTLNIYIKTDFSNNKITKNISYKINNINDEVALTKILKSLKMEINDLWKEENLVNLLMPLSIDIKFKHKNLNSLDSLRNTFYKIDIIDNFLLKEFNTNNSFFKIYYYGNPKKLKSKLSKFGYQLENKQGQWQLYTNE
jgi:hypothetical protein